MAPGHLSLSPVSAEDFEELAALRIAAMRDSLERVGRFDPERARDRLRKSFYPQATQFIRREAEKVGFSTFRLVEDGFRLDHLYIHPSQQSRGIGSWVLRQLIAIADEKQRPIRLGALRESPSNRFYLHHGFEVESEDAWDVYYVRPPGAPGTATSIPQRARPRDRDS